MPKAFKILAAGLKASAKESIDSDVKEIAKLTGKHENTINLYFKGDVRDFNTGSVILTELNRLIKDRENFAMELVA